MAAAVTAVGVAANLVFLDNGYRSYFKPANLQQRGALSALDIAGPSNPSFVLNANTSPVTFFDINTAAYLSAVRAFGSPAYSESELASASETSRQEADRVMGAMLGLELKPGGSASGPCRIVTAAAGPPAGVELRPGRVTLQARAGTKAEAKLGRFSDQLPFDAGSLKSGSRASLTVPADRSARPWRLGLEGRGQATVCGPGVGGAPLG